MEARSDDSGGTGASESENSDDSVIISADSDEDAQLSSSTTEEDMLTKSFGQIPTVSGNIFSVILPLLCLLE
jgi:hypothetical protein